MPRGSGIRVVPQSKMVLRVRGYELRRGIVAAIRAKAREWAESEANAVVLEARIHRGMSLAHSQYLWIDHSEDMAIIAAQSVTGR